MNTSCGYCHRTGQELITGIGEDDYEFCLACATFHFYESHGWMKQDSEPDFGCPQAHTNVQSIIIALEHIPGSKHYVVVNYRDGHHRFFQLDDRKMDSVWRVVVRDDRFLTHERRQEKLPYIGKRTIAEYTYPV